MFITVRTSMVRLTKFEGPRNANASDLNDRTTTGTILINLRRVCGGICHKKYLLTGVSVHLFLSNGRRTAAVRHPGGSVVC